MSEAASEKSAKIDGAFVRARVGSLLAVVPLAAWTVVHLWNNLAAFTGGPAWEDSVTHYGHPLAHFTTMGIVLLPLALHTAWGIKRLVTSRPNNQKYGTFHNLKYLVQRLSAVGVLLFLGAHIWKAMLEPRFVHGHPETFGDIAQNMAHHPPTLAVYVLGTLGVSYHLSNGLASFAMGWGLVASRRALGLVEKAMWLVFFVLLLMSWGVIFAMWRAGQ
jgi:succinate dehydrogenase / fumarate reductase cytochrome b subunit